MLDKTGSAKEADAVEIESSLKRNSLLVRIDCASTHKRPGKLRGKIMSTRPPQGTDTDTIPTFNGWKPADERRGGDVVAGLTPFIRSMSTCTSISAVKRANGSQKPRSMALYKLQNS
jgi:hypothetical protein